MNRRDPHVDNAGFSLIETLAALALMGLILSALAGITSQWLPNWNRGFARIQNSESVSIALERICTDIGAAEFVTADRAAKQVLFDGTELSVTLVRPSLGPNARPGLEVVRIAESTEGKGFVLTRSQAQFTPGAAGQLNFTNPVVLLRAPYRVSFSYAARDSKWKNTWREASELPAAVLMTVRDAATEAPLGISRIAPIHINASAESTCSEGCEAKPAAASQASSQNASTEASGRHEQ